MNILVTGGAGFIGSHLVDKLISLDHEVIIVDNLITGSKKNLNKQAKFYELDIKYKNELEKIFQNHNFDYVFHMAAGYLVQSLENPQRDAETNIIGTINLIQLCLKYKIKKIIYSNSGGASYGEPQQIPIPEDHQVKPLTPYGASKYAGEMYLYMYHKNHNLNFISLRYGNVYGPRQNPLLEGGVISVFLNSFLKGESPIMKSDGTPTRDYIYIDDVIDANILAMNSDKVDCYNLASGIETSVLDLIKIMKGVIQTDLEVIQGEPRIGDPQRAVFNIEKIKSDLKWHPKTSLKEGITKTAEWVKNFQTEEKIK